MHLKNKRLVALLAVLPMAAATQTAAPRPNPLDAKAPTAPLTYRSSLGDYRRFDADSPATGWREANDVVERIGGWRAYAREANAPEPAASAPASAPVSAPASAPRAARPAAPAPAHRH
jgi:hypothetical protein